MTARPIGEIIAPIVARATFLAWFQDRINAQPNPLAKKHLIGLYYEIGAIDHDQAQILVEANML